MAFREKKMKTEFLNSKKQICASTVYTVGHFNDAPHLPFEYLFAVNIVCIPQLWFACVDPRVDALRDLATGKKGNKTAYDN